MKRYQLRIALLALDTQEGSTLQLYAVGKEMQMIGLRSHPENFFVLTGMRRGLYFLPQLAGTVENIVHPYSPLAGSTTPRMNSMNSMSFNAQV